MVRKLRLHRRVRSGFLLLETMIGVSIFAIGVLVLGWSMQHCLNAEIRRSWDQLARLALENRMSEVEAGVVQVSEEASEEALTGRYQGLVVKQWREPLELKNERNEQLSNLYVVYIEATWTLPEGAQSKSIRFYVLGS